LERGQVEALKKGNERLEEITPDRVSEPKGEFKRRIR